MVGVTGANKVIKINGLLQDEGIVWLLILLVFFGVYPSLFWNFFIASRESLLRSALLV